MSAEDLRGERAALLTGDHDPEQRRPYEKPTVTRATPSAEGAYWQQRLAEVTAERDEALARAAARGKVLEWEREAGMLTFWDYTGLADFVRGLLVSPEEFYSDLAVRVGIRNASLLHDEQDAAASGAGDAT